MSLESSTFPTLTSHSNQKSHCPNKNSKPVHPFRRLAFFVLKHATSLEKIVDEGKIVILSFLFVIEDDSVKIIDNSQYLLQDVFVVSDALPVDYVLLAQSNS
jgi:hypothetical protein